MEEFSNGSSWVHRLDPRVKILVALIFSIVVALDNRLEVALISLAAPVILSLWARLGLKPLLARMAIINGFNVFLWLFLPFTTPGTPVYQLWGLAITSEGIKLATLLTIKSNSIVLMVTVMLGTSQVFSLAHALSHLYVPDKLVHLFFFCFRYIHVIEEEYSRLVTAMKMRGFRPRTDVHTYRSYSYLIGMLLVRSFDRSKRIMQAMKLRGFKKRFYILHHYEMKSCDYAMALSGVVFSTFVLVTR